tara:strand:- start:4995 stop:6182 length:1188 start_codon:yes stop_codon:yes gene_type:complete
MLNKKIFLILIIPSFFLNYFTLTIIDHDNNLSTFSSLIVFLFNFFNLILAYIFSYYGFLKSLRYFFIIIFSILFFDTAIIKLQENNSIQIYDEELGWILNNSLSLKIDGYTKQKQQYKINFSTSEVKGFREFDDKRKNKKNILIIGDSFTAGPFASNDQMYYSYIKQELEKAGYFLNWFVAGGGGYGTLQQYLLIKKYFDEINPDVLIHQFCNNDFENNLKKIEENSILRNQYYFRPYLVNDKIIYDDTISGKLYRFFYRNSFLFKKIDNIITNHKFKKNGYFNKKIHNENLDNSFIKTSEIFKKIKDLVGDEIIYVSMNCSTHDDKKMKAWEKILKKYEIISLVDANLVLSELSKKGEDIFFSDGAHLNNYGNKIFGKKIGISLIEIIRSNDNF